MQWYCKPQLFTSHQAQRSQRRNMSQHAKQCKLEQPRFPETQQNKSREGKKKSFQSDQSRAKLRQSPNTTHTAGTSRGGSHIYSTYSSVRSGMDQSRGFEWKKKQQKKYPILWIRTQRSHSACVPTIMWKAEGTESVLFSILFFPRRNESSDADLDYRGRRTRTSCLEKCEHDASKL